MIEGDGELTVLPAHRRCRVGVIPRIRPKCVATSVLDAHPGSLDTVISAISGPPLIGVQLPSVREGGLLTCISEGVRQVGLAGELEWSEGHVRATLAHLTVAAAVPISISVMPTASGPRPLCWTRAWRIVVITAVQVTSCNGRDTEVIVSLTPLYGHLERFGIINTGNPKHAVYTPCHRVGQ